TRTACPRTSTTGRRLKVWKYSFFSRSTQPVCCTWLTTGTPFDHRANPEVGEKLTDQRVRLPPVDDVGLLDDVERPNAGGRLRDHAARDHAARDQVARLRRGELAQQRAVAVLDARHVGQEQQLSRAEPDRDLGRGRVGVEVQVLSALTERDRRDDRYV